MSKRDLTPEEQAEVDEMLGDCEPCQVAVFGGSLIFVCQNEAGNQDVCEDLNDRFSDGQLTVREVYNRVREMVPPRIQEQLDAMIKQGDKLGIPYDVKLPPGGVTPDMLDEA